MQTDELRELLDQPALAESRLAGWGLENPRRGHANLMSMAAAGLTLDLLEAICAQLAEHLPRVSDPDRALNNLDRFVQAARNPLSLGSLFERDSSGLPILLQIFSTSQHLSDLLILDQESYDLLRMTEGQPVDRDTLANELAAEIDALTDEAAVMAALRRFKRRETLRISYGDLIRGQRLEMVTQQISYLADAVVEAAVRFARRRLSQRRGTPRRPDGQPSQFVVLGMGKLGGTELNYSSDIDLIFLYEADGRTDGDHPTGNVEYFERLARDVVRLLTEPTALGYPYRVDLRLRPEGERGPVVHSLERAMRYYDVAGRTWERQAYVKARPVAGDLALGRQFLEYLEPWIYRRYLGLADITGIKALKRRIEHRAVRESAQGRNVKTGHGGIRDIEFVIQFLQLLNGGDLPALRTGNTLEAIAQLEKCGCLTPQERSLLEEHYGFLRKIEHRLQIMFDLQTHVLPSDPDEMRKLALRMGYTNAPQQAALEAFESDYQTKTELNRKILDHLLHDAFGDDAETEPEVDLVLDPDPSPERLAEVLGRHGFRNVKLAYQNLSALALERIRFLSTRRCRHFLASIAPRLLKTIGSMPDPDSTLVNLEKVSDSLGGKGVLWELFSFNPPTMNLYVELCASSPFLSGILTSNPGMIDELMDSLVLNKLPTRALLDQTMADVTRGAEDLDPILHSFKNTQQLRIGVRDILGKDDVQATMGALSDIAEACLVRIAESEYEKLTEKLGEPTIAAGPRAGQRCELTILALGKLGGRELNYHSDLDVVFLYEADGMTVHNRRGRKGETTNNQHFFSELGQRIIKTASHLGPYGRLYEIDPRLRPTGKSGALAMPLAEFVRYFTEGQGRLWERQALCKARVVYGSPEAAARTLEAAHQAAFEPQFEAADAVEIAEMRQRLEASAHASNIKRGRGGLVDIEFLVQMLQLKFGRDDRSLRVPGTLAALAALFKAGHLSNDDFKFFTDSYRFLRTMEARLRLMSTTARDDLPDSPVELSKLAHALGYSDPQPLVERTDEYRQRNRARFEALLASEA
ncbi:MAG TPA: bifunctional [glutamate--ammonia ligase]-adenylyl-L-tyrosine phosphorylase/[glutamate--ammonia-ligase] adenylyltransferase [Pirellulales bacterium]|jgi:glutamate-ammonia-ligase adenylyltransferase|nr:bifunctional [glutamate--ammonia ligase]-adenylyl-L-tyrosine phosphorylase/[glutamate--ammonia-ligase] adenylyltransferase [Pirellulales bacterium]